MCWVQYLLDALSIRMRPASLVIPKKGMTGFFYSFKEINTMTELLHLPGLDKQMASFKKSKTLPPQSCNNLGECLPNF